MCVYIYSIYMCVFVYICNYLFLQNVLIFTKKNFTYFYKKKILVEWKIRNQEATFLLHMIIKDILEHLDTITISFTTLLFNVHCFIVTTSITCSLLLLFNKPGFFFFLIGLVDESSGEWPLEECGGLGNFLFWAVRSAEPGSF